MGLFKSAFKMATGDFSGATKEALKTVIGEKAAEELSDSAIKATKQLLTSGTVKLNGLKTESGVNNSPSPEVIEQNNNIVSTATQIKPNFKYYIAVGGKKQGPYNAQQFSDLVNSGSINVNTLVWCSGMSNWTKAGKIDELSVFFK